MKLLVIMKKLHIIILLLTQIFSQDADISLDSSLNSDSSLVRLEYDYKQFLDSIKVAYQDYVIKKPLIQMTYQSVFRFQPMMIRRYSALESHTVPREFLLSEEAISGVYRRSFVGINFLAIIPLALHLADIDLTIWQLYGSLYAGTN